MANWCNLRLVAIGRPVDVAPFRRAAGARRGRIDTRKSQVFTIDMECGEGRDLEADGVSRFHGTLQRAVYLFQGCNDDHADHFREISRRFPRLALVLVFSDRNADAHGSYLFRAGRRRMWDVPERLKSQLLAAEYEAYGVVTDAGTIDYDAPEADDAEWDACWRMMDVAERHWDRQVLEWLTAQDGVKSPAGRKTT